MDRSSRDAQRALANAQDYRSWREASAHLDQAEGLDDWKADETSELYDWRLIRSRLRQVRQFREEGAIKRLAHHLRQGLHWNLGNIGNAEIYCHARVGTKQLIIDYIADEFQRQEAWEIHGIPPERVAVTTTVSKVTDDYVEAGRAHSLQDKQIPPYVAIFRIHGPLLFGVTDKVARITDHLDELPPIVIVPVASWVTGTVPVL